MNSYYFQKKQNYLYFPGMKSGKSVMIFKVLESKTMSGGLQRRISVRQKRGLDYFVKNSWS